MALGKDLWDSADDFSRMCGVQSAMAARFYALGRMLAEAEVSLALGLQPGRRAKAQRASSALRKTRCDAGTRRKRAAKACQCRMMSTRALSE